MLTPFCPQTIECICTYYISVCIRSGLILLLRSLHCIYWDHRAVGSGAWGLWWFKTPIPHPLAGSKTISSISPRIIPLPSWFSGLPTPLDGVVVGKNSSKQMCMTKTGWCCCVTRPHFSPHASSNRAVCAVCRMLPQRYAACCRAAGSMTLDLPRIFLFLPVPVQRLLLIVKPRYCMDGRICNFAPCKEQ